MGCVPHQPVPPQGREERLVAEDLSKLCVIFVPRRDENGNRLPGDWVAARYWWIRGRSTGRYHIVFRLDPERKSGMPYEAYGECGRWFDIDQRPGKQENPRWLHMRCSSCLAWEERRRSGKVQQG